MLKETEVILPCESVPCDSLFEYDFCPREIWCLIVNNLYDQQRVRWFFSVVMSVSRSWREMAYSSVTVFDRLHCNSLNKLANGVQVFVSLRTLVLPVHSTVSMKGLSPLVNLTYLDISKTYERYVTDHGMYTLTNLTTFLAGMTQLSNNALTGLTKLTTLSIARSKTLGDGGISGLTNLTHLSLASNSIVSNYGIRPLRNLTKLDISGSCGVTDAGVTSLGRLQSPMCREIDSSLMPLCFTSRN